jgi:hypothetical protein
VKKISINGYEYCNLSSDDIRQIEDLESSLNKKMNDKEKVILLAFNDAN